MAINCRAVRECIGGSTNPTPHRSCSAPPGQIFNVIDYPPSSSITRCRSNPIPRFSKSISP